eukprot:scaffold46129_cov153-Amphora_coffeaeformis.AAC.1
MGYAVYYLYRRIQKKTKGRLNPVVTIHFQSMAAVILVHGFLHLIMSEIVNCYIDPTSLPTWIKAIGLRWEGVDRRGSDEFRADRNNSGSHGGHGLGMDTALHFFNFPPIGMHSGPVFQITHVYTNYGMDFSTRFEYGNPRIDAVFHPLPKAWRARLV